MYIYTHLCVSAYSYICSPLQISNRLDSDLEFSMGLDMTLTLSISPTKQSLKKTCSGLAKPCIGINPEKKKLRIQCESVTRCLAGLALFRTTPSTVSLGLGSFSV